jgi:succinyl-diaminopimelate desuccinylase
VTESVDQLDRFLEVADDSLVETTLDLLAADTQNPPGATESLTDYATAFFEELGVTTERITVDPAKPNVLATIPGQRETTLLYNGHFDTVPYDGADWEHDPLGERDGERIYGRGATDMKGAVAAMLTTAAAYAETETTPPVTLQFLLVSDEETGGPAGIEAVFDRHSVGADGCVIGETTCERGRYSVTVADRGSIWLTLSATGAGAHGSRPILGENAIDRLYEAVERIRRQFGSERLELDPALDPIIADSIDYYEPMMGTTTASDLFTTPTVNLGVIEGGESINSVPQRATARVDIRLTASVDTRRVLSQIRDCVEGCPGVAIDDATWSLGTFEPVDGPLVSAVAETAEAAVADHVYRRSATGGGDAAMFRNEGIPTVEFGVGTDTAHAVEEYTTVSALRTNALVYARLPYTFADRVGP